MAELRVKVDVDNADAKRKLGEVDKAAEELKSKQGADAKTFLDGMSAKADALLGKLKLVAAAGAAAMGAIGAAAVNSYAKYEQMEGGIGKIFDEADVSQILADADAAYVDLNMSANDYLESISKTGATFAQTMGDQKGYDTARKGMKAIADYASGTGRDLGELNDKFSMITRATSSYQSIADQFSGILPATSKDFLEQAQAAGFLSGEYTKLTDVPVAEYQEAVAQMLEKGVDDMGLLGNTAAESTETVSGSLAMMQGAWENWLTALGREDVDMGEMTQRLMDAIGNVVDNVGPVIQRVGATMLQELPGIFADVIAGVPGMLSGFAEAVAQGLEANGLDGAAEAVRAIGDGLSGAFQWLIDNGDLVAAILGSIGGAMLALMAYQSITGIISGITGAFALFNAVLAANPIVLIVMAIGLLVGGLLALLASNEEFRAHFMEAWNGIVAFFQALPGNIGAFLSALIAFVSQWVSNMVTLAVAVGTQFVQNVISFFQSLPGRISGFLSSVISNVTGFAGRMASGAANAASQFASRLMSGLQSIPGRVFSIGTQIINGIRDGVLNAAGGLVSSVTNAVSGAIGAAKSFLGIASPSKLFRDEVGRWIPLGVAEGIEREADAVGLSIERALGIDLTPMGWTGQVVAQAQAMPQAPQVQQNVTNNVYEREDAYVAATIFSRALMQGV